MLEQDKFYTSMYGKQVSYDCTVKTNMLPEHQTWCSKQAGKLNTCFSVNKDVFLQHAMLAFSCVNVSVCFVIFFMLPAFHTPLVS